MTSAFNPDDQLHSPMAGYDLVLALGEGALNDQLNQLSAQGFIASAWSATIGNGASLQVDNMGAPQVSFSGAGLSPQDLLMILPLNAGTFSKNGVSLPFNGWRLAFRVNMGLAGLSGDDLSARINARTTPANTANAIGAAQQTSPASLQIWQLFFNFPATDFRDLDTTNSTLDLSGVPDDERADTQTDILDTLAGYFQTLSGNANPFVLCYPLAASSAPSSSAWTPTALAFSTVQGALNTLMMVNGDTPPDVNTAGVFGRPWIMDGAPATLAAYGPLLLTSVAPALTAAVGSWPITSFQRMGGGSWARLNVGVSGGPLDGGTLTVVLNAQPGGNQLRADFQYSLTKEIKALGFIPSGSVTQHATWSVIYAFNVDSSGQVQATPAGQIGPNVSYSEDKKWWSYIIDVFVPVAAFSEAIDQMVSMNSFPNVSDGVWTVSTAQLNLVLPFGGSFLYSNTRFDEFGDLVWDAAIQG